ncbi:MAG: caspase family protein [Acidobacteriota bacterium]
MRTSLSHKRFLSVSLLALMAMASYWLWGTRVETAESRIVVEERPPMFVLQVGIGKYVNAPPLSGSVNDVVEMRKVLEGERYQIPPSNIVTLTDAEGTKQKIFEKFQTHLIAKAREHFEKTGSKDAVVMFQFSGHGSQVPDVDGDEKDDGKDETLVTYDSRDKTGENRDITDDEIYALTSELRRWTDNIVYIFDSCHSGSGTRDAQDVRRVPERKTVPVAIAGVGSATRSGATKPADDASSILPPGDDYIVITAARSGELASQKNCFEECGDARRPVVFGNLTFYLVDELRNARCDTSYRELMENVTRRVLAEKPTQTPQLEGDKSRFVFGSLGRSEDNFIHISGGEMKAANGVRSLKIRAGAMQGLTVGTMISIYDRSVTRFDGAEKIASGIVRTVTPIESTVELIIPKREVSIDDKAIVVAPDLGSLRLKVSLDIDSAKFTPAEKKVIAGTQALLTPQSPSGRREVDFVATRAGEPARWDVAVVKDRFSNVVTKIPGARADSFRCAMPTVEDEKALGPVGKPDRDVFYFAGRDFVPLFGFCMETAANEVSAAERFQKALTHLASLKSINLIENRRSALKGKITVKPIKLSGVIGCTNSAFTAATIESPKADPETGAFAFDPGDYFWFEVTNNSAKPLYVALLNVDPNGAVTVFSPRGQRAEEAEGVIISAGGKRIIVGDDCRAEDGTVVEAAVLLASKTPGSDRFKFIFSTDKITYDDFAYLERPALMRRAGSAASLASVSDWTTVETIFNINDTGK